MAEPIDDAPEPAPEPEELPAGAATVPAEHTAADHAMPVDLPMLALDRLAAPAAMSQAVRRHDRLLTAAWAASFALLAGLGVAGFTERDQLMRHWPASQRVYAGLGLIPAGSSPRPSGTADAAGAPDRSARK